MVVVDTSVIIDHLRQPADKSILLKIVKSLGDESFAASVISIQELYEGKSTLDEVKESYLLATLGTLEILPYNTEVAQLAGKIARDLETPIELADAAIAATAIANEASLATLNIKHFAKIPGLEMLELPL